MHLNTILNSGYSNHMPNDLYTLHSDRQFVLNNPRCLITVSVKYFRTSSFQEPTDSHLNLFIPFYFFQQTYYRFLC